MEQSPLEAVAQLMSERAKFEKWLADLEAKRTSTPSHVFDRVKADYSLRLDAVLEKLREHTAEMREHADNLTKKLQELEDSEQNLLDEKAEHALRAEVGELSESEWDSFSRKAERTLGKLQEEQEVIASDLEQIRDLLGSVETKPKTAPPPVVAATPARARPGVDELEFLKSVVGTTPSGTPNRAPAPKPLEATAEAKPDVKAPAPAAPPVTRTPAATTAIPPAAEPMISKPVTGPTIQSRPNADSNSIGTRVSGSSPLTFRDTGSQDVPRTLKCAECGAMNYPSEWYCERCGAELVNI